MAAPALPGGSHRTFVPNTSTALVKLIVWMAILVGVLVALAALAAILIEDLVER